MASLLIDENAGSIIVRLAEVHSDLRETVTRVLSKDKLIHSVASNPQGHSVLCSFITTWTGPEVVVLAEQLKEMIISLIQDSNGHVVIESLATCDSKAVLRLLLDELNTPELEGILTHQNGLRLLHRLAKRVSQHGLLEELAKLLSSYINNLVQHTSGCLILTEIMKE